MGHVTSSCVSCVHSVHTQENDLLPGGIPVPGEGHPKSHGSASSSSAYKFRTTSHHLPEYKKALQHFQKVDIDGDGKVSIEEYLAAMNTDLRDSWLTDFLELLWPSAERALSQLLEENIEVALQRKLAGVAHLTGTPLAGLQVQLGHIQLGQVPPRVGPIFAYQKDKGNMKGIQVDAGLNFEADVDLKIVMGPLDIGVSRVEFDGVVSFVLRPLLPVVPVVGGFQVFFMNPPDITLTFTGLAGIADSGFGARTIRRLVEGAFERAVVLPHRVAYKVPSRVYRARLGKSISSSSLVAEDGDQVRLKRPVPQGMLRVWALEARDLVGADFSMYGPSTSDPYAKLKLGGQEVRTSVVQANCNPVWGPNDFGEFLVYNVRQRLQMDVLDQDLMKQDDLLGALPDRVYSVAALVMLQASADVLSTEDPSIWVPLDTEVEGVAAGAQDHNSRVRLKVQYFQIGHAPGDEAKPSSAVSTKRINGALDHSLNLPVLLSVYFYHIVMKEVKGAVVVVHLLDAHGKGVEDSRHLAEVAQSVPCNKMTNAELFEAIDPRVQEIILGLHAGGKLTIAEIADVVKLDEADVRDFVAVAGKSADLPGEARVEKFGWKDGVHLIVANPTIVTVRLELMLPREGSCGHKDISLAELLRKCQGGATFRVEHLDNCSKGDAELKIELDLHGITALPARRSLEMLTGETVSEEYLQTAVQSDLNLSKMPSRLRPWVIGDREATFTYARMTTHMETLNETFMQVEAEAEEIESQRLMTPSSTMRDRAKGLISKAREGMREALHRRFAGFGPQRASCIVQMPPPHMVELAGLLTELPLAWGDYVDPVPPSVEGQLSQWGNMTWADGIDGVCGDAHPAGRPDTQDPGYASPHRVRI
mmetsp:Transcript_58809/g.108618  ORF Transcript_58809/g.108618 Transcript_58809/m.108618 type:complete len:874 (+) Transcript_58809:35-2656(+)